MRTRKEPRVTVLFVDGLGVGPRDPSRNPLAWSGADYLGVFQEDLEHSPKPQAVMRSRSAESTVSVAELLTVNSVEASPPPSEKTKSYYREHGDRTKLKGLSAATLAAVAMPDGGQAKGIDAQLGVVGIPQSATGQTALLTGVNVARLVGRHMSGFPNRQLRKIIFEHSLLRKLRQAGLRTAFVNAYTPIFYDKPLSTLVRYISATTMACMSSGQLFFSLDDLRAGRALYQEFTNQDLIKRGFKVPKWEPERAGEILADISAKYNFCLYEYFRTDRAGHSMDPEWAAEVLNALNRFVGAFLRGTDLATQTVLLVSDHGNIEDLSCRTHTNNGAVAATWGYKGSELLTRINCVSDLTPALLKYFELDNEAIMHVQKRPPTQFSS